MRNCVLRGSRCIKFLSEDLDRRRIVAALHSSKAFDEHQSTVYTENKRIAKPYQKFNLAETFEIIKDQNVKGCA